LTADKVLDQMPMTLVMSAKFWLMFLGLWATAKHFLV